MCRNRKRHYLVNHFYSNSFHQKSIPLMFVTCYMYLIAWWFFVCLSVKSFIFVENWFSTLFRHDVWWICPCIPFSISNKWEKIACKLNLHDNDDKSLHSILNLSSIDLIMDSIFVPFPMSAGNQRGMTWSILHRQKSIISFEQKKSSKLGLTTMKVVFALFWLFLPVSYTCPNKITFKHPNKSSTQAWGNASRHETGKNITHAGLLTKQK